MNGLHVAAPLDVQTVQANIAQKAVNHPISNVYCAKSRTELVLPNVEGKLGVLISSKLAFPRRIVHPLVYYPQRSLRVQFSSLKSPETDLPAPQIEQLDTKRENLSNPGSVPAWSTLSSALTHSAQQLRDRLSAIETDLQSEPSNLRRGSDLKLEAIEMPIRFAQHSLAVGVIDEIL